MKKFVSLLLLSSLTLFQGCGAQWFPDDATGPTPQPVPSSENKPDAQADTKQTFNTYTVGTLTGATTTTVSITGSNDLGSGTTSSSSYTIVRSSASSVTEGPFYNTDPAQTVSTGDKITVSHTSANGTQSTASSFLSVGGARATYSSTTSQLAFRTRRGVGISASVQSDIITIPQALPSSLTFPATIIVDAANSNATNNEIWINGQFAANSASSASVAQGQSLQLRHTSSATSGTMVTTTATITETAGTGRTYKVTFKSVP